MKQVIATLAAFLFVLNIAAQIPEKSNVHIGVNLTKKDYINATRLKFGGFIYNTKLDSATKTLFIELRNLTKDSSYYENEGKLIALDLMTKELKWQKDVDYSITKVMYNDDHIFFNILGGTTSCVNKKNGEELWNSNHPFLISFPKMNIALGYKNKGFAISLSDELECVDLNKGTTRWSKTVNKDFGWNGVFVKNDSTIIIKSSGLKELNILDGTGWNYVTQTGIKNYSHKLQQNLNSLQMGILNGTFDISKGNNLLSELTSDLLVTNDAYYFASKEKIAKLTFTGTVIWETKLSSETSHSQIFIYNNNLYLLNEGRAKFEGKEIDYGKPYMSAYQLNTGKEIFKTALYTKGYSLVSHEQKNDTIELIFADRIMQLSLTNGAIINNYKYITSQVGLFNFEVNKQKVFVEKDSLLKSLSSINNTNKYLFNSRKQIVTLKSNFQYAHLLQMDDIYKLCASTDLFNFYFNKDKLVASNKNGLVLARLNMGNNTFLFENKLYEIGAGSIIEVDISQLK